MKYTHPLLKGDLTGIKTGIKTMDKYLLDIYLIKKPPDCFLQSGGFLKIKT